MWFPIFSGRLLACLLIVVALPAAYGQYGDITTTNIPPSGWTNTSWGDPGGWTTINVTQNDLPANRSDIDAAQKIREIIAATSGRRILFFPAGTYYFKSNLVIRTGDLRLRGAGNTSTTFRISAASSANASITFEGNGEQTEVDVTNEPIRTAQTANVPNGSVFDVGNTVEIYNKGGSFAAGQYNEAQIMTITGISGNTLTLDFKFGISFNSNPKIRKLSMLQNVGFESFNVVRDNSTSSGTPNLGMNFVLNGYVKAVESAFCQGSHIAITGCRRVVVENNTCYDGFDFGGGGNGYGVLVNRNSTRVRITNNKLWNLRHHIILARGANHCVVSYNSTESEYRNTGGGGTTVPDLDLHGFDPHNNLFEGNNGYTLASDSRSDANANSIIGRYNSFFRNRLTNTYFIDDASTVGNRLPFRFIVVGNCFRYQPGVITGTEHFIGNNYQIQGDVLRPGDLTSTSNVPTSLYFSGKPQFLSGKPWPVFGPGVGSGGTYGKDNSVPAYDRARTAVCPTVNTASACSGCREISPELFINAARTYPNPARDEATFVFMAQEAQSTTIRCSDPSGKTVHTVPVRLNEGLNEVKINLTGWQRGMYILSAPLIGETIQAKLLVNE
jgi:hypothetical protein